MEGTACITKIVKERHEEPVTVYNLAVKDWVSYFVGKVRVYVHNGNGYDGGKESLWKPTTKKMIYGIKENLKNIMKNMVFQNLEQDHQKNIQKWHMNLVLEILITLLKL